MKRFNLYLGMLGLTMLATGCNDEFDTPPMVVPTATHTANMTIAEFKAKHWQDVNNYIDTVKEDEVIHGRVVSSDATGNIYKSLYIQDETGGISISINGSSLYNTYRVGQEIVIPMKNLYVGKYNGQQQLGYPQYYEKSKVWEASFMPLAQWQAVAELNGLPNPSKIDTVACNIADLKTNAESLKKWQGRLVKISGVKFQDADGTATFAKSDASTNRNIVDEQGGTLVVRNSNYATFRAAMLPMGKGDVVGVLSYYNTSRTSIEGGTWQLFLRSADDCIGFSTSTKGLASDPYTTQEAIKAQNTGKSGWVTGFVVGAVAPEVTAVKSNDDVEWKAPTTLANTLVIGPTANTKDIKQCLVVTLPQNSPFRAEANLKDFPEVYQTKIMVKGTLATNMGTHGITGNSGAKGEYQLSVVTGGVSALNETFEQGLPATWAKIAVKGDKSWYTTKFQDNTYAAMTGFKGKKPPFDSWLITPALNIKKAKNKTLTFRTQVNGYGSTTTKLEVYVMDSPDPTKAKLHKLAPTLATAPEKGYSTWTESGAIDLSGFDGIYFVAFRYEAQTDASYATWCVDDVKFGDNAQTVAPRAMRR